MADVTAALAALRSVVVWPDDEIDVVAAAVTRLGARPAPRRRWPAIAFAVGVSVAVAVPVAAELLGVEGIRIVRGAGELPDGLGAVARFGVRVPVREDEPRPPVLGPPLAAFVGEPEGGYTEVWDGPIFLTRFPGVIDEALIEKRVHEGGTVERTTVDGDPAYWIGGPHGLVYVGPDRLPREDTLRLSGSALVWTRGGVTFRLESDRTLAEARQLAESMF